MSWFGLGPPKPKAPLTNPIPGMIPLSDAVSETFAAPTPVPDKPVPVPAPELTGEEIQSQQIKISASNEKITIEIPAYNLTIDMYPAGAELLVNRIRKAIMASKVMSGEEKPAPRKQRDRTRVRSAWEKKK